MRFLNVALGLAALLMGAGGAWSTGEWMDGADRGRADYNARKKELIASAGLFELHNAVYAQVGPEAWESRVKPQFMSSITTATIRETGNPLPEARDVVAWVRAHPKEARRLMREAARSVGPDVRSATTDAR